MENIKFAHIRAYQNEYWDEYILPNLGFTIAYTITGNVLSLTWARCSHKDHYCKYVGREVAKNSPQKVAVEIDAKISRKDEYRLVRQVFSAINHNEIIRLERKFGVKFR